MSTCKQDNAPTSRFAGKQVLVTGAASGIGRCIAEHFVAEGAHVIGLDCQPADVPFQLLAVDIADAADVIRVSDQIRASVQSLDVLINAAGILKSGTSDTLSDADWHACMDVNVSGPFYLMRYWAPLFRERRSGAIVNIASNAAHVPRINMAGYCASKAALVSLSHCVALELAPSGVRCNVVSPGSTLTPMLNGVADGPAGQQQLVSGLPEQFKSGIPLAKIANPNDIAGVVLFLASSAAGHITMQDIVVDGGATLGA